MFLRLSFSPPVWSRRLFPQPIYQRCTTTSSRPKRTEYVRHSRKKEAKPKPHRFRDTHDPNSTTSSAYPSTFASSVLHHQGKEIIFFLPKKFTSQHPSPISLACVPRHASALAQLPPLLLLGTPAQVTYRQGGWRPSWPCTARVSFPSSPLLIALPCPWRRTTSVLLSTSQTLQDGPYLTLPDCSRSEKELSG